MKRDCGHPLVFTAYITLRNGQILYASQCGKRAFVFCPECGGRRKR
jgi:hypothetical protein